MSNYLKCSASHLKHCWPGDFIHIYQISQASLSGSRQNIISAIKSIPRHHPSSLPVAIKNQATLLQMGCKCRRFPGATRWTHFGERCSFWCFDGFVLERRDRVYATTMMRDSSDISIHLFSSPICHPLSEPSV